MKANAGTRAEIVARDLVMSGKIDRRDMPAVARLVANAMEKDRDRLTGEEEDTLP